MADRETIAYAMSDLVVRQRNYNHLRRYYHGDHDLRFASDAFRQAFGSLLKTLQYNRCGAVVDAIADRIQIEAWESGDGNDTTNDTAEEIWAANRGDWLAGVVHIEALTSGDAYVIVWPDRDGNPRMRPNRADMVNVLYRDEDPDDVECAIKVWRVQRGEYAGRWRMTVYERDMITRWITKGPQDEQPKKIDGMIPFEDEWGAELPNPYDTVPVIPFPNNQLLPGDHGISELRDVIPLQDGLNKSLSDMIVAGEFLAYPQRWAVGVEPQVNPLTGQTVETFEPGIDRMLMVADAQARFGEFSAADMRQFLDMLNSWDQMISRVSRIPTFWLGMSGDFPSGEALKTAEAPFVSKVRDRQVLFGAAWTNAMRLALMIANDSNPDNVEPVFSPPVARSEVEFWQLAQMKRAIGVPDEQLWKEAGYTEEQILNFTAVQMEQRERQAAMFGQAFDAGRIG